MEDFGNADLEKDPSDSQDDEDEEGSAKDDQALTAALEEIKRVALEAEATVRRLHEPKSKGKEKNKRATTQTTAVALHGVASSSSGPAAVQTASQPGKVRLENINMVAELL